jgi:myo-inositol 2-dehydrogenase/D-chiro-inositol 1-dehydrogenase
VVVAVPPDRTCAVASAVLERGLPVLVEKPPGLTADELARLIAAARGGRGRAQVGFNRRFMPVTSHARARLGAGPITRIDYEMKRRDRWDPDFSTTAIHAIDLLRFLAGPFKAATIDYQVHTSAGGEAVDVTVELEHGSGTRTRLAIRPVTDANTEILRIHQADQLVVVRLPYPEDAAADGMVECWKGNECVDRYSDGGLEEIERMGIVGETTAFLHAVRSGAIPAPGLDDCFEQVELMEAIRLRRAPQIFFESRSDGARSDGKGADQRQRLFSCAPPAPAGEDT